jgi:hypothetical protein
MIRPLTVLKKSLVHVLNKYSKSNDYRYICDQMKAIRQDLTVSHFKDLKDYFKIIYKLYIEKGSNDSKRVHN